MIKQSNFIANLVQGTESTSQPALEGTIDGIGNITTSKFSDGMLDIISPEGKFKEGKTFFFTGGRYANGGADAPQQLYRVDDNTLRTDMGTNGCYMPISITVVEEVPDYSNDQWVAIFNAKSTLAVQGLTFPDNTLEPVNP